MTPIYPTCPLCLTAIAEGDYIIVCRDCGAAYHEECWSANAGCSTPNCSQNHAEDEQYRRQSYNWSMISGNVQAHHRLRQSMGHREEYKIITNREQPAISDEDQFPDYDSSNGEYNTYESYESYDSFPDTDSEHINDQNEPFFTSLYGSEYDTQTPPALRRVAPTVKPISFTQLNMLRERQLTTLSELNENTPSSEQPVKRNTSASPYKRMQYHSPPSSPEASVLKKNVHTAPKTEPTQPSKLENVTERIKTERTKRFEKIKPKTEKHPKPIGNAVIISAAAAVVIISILVLVTIPPKAENVSFPKSTCVVGLNDEQTLIYTVEPESAGRRKKTWQTSNPSIASVENGVVKAMGEGECDVTLTIGDISTTEHIKIVPEIVGVEIENHSIELVSGERNHVLYTVTPKEAQDADAAFVSSDESIVTVEDGRIRAVQEGTAEITVMVGEKTATLTVNVLPKAMNMELDEKECTIKPGEEKKVTCKIMPEKASKRTPELRSTNPDIVKIENDKIIGVTEGQCEVIASIDGITRKMSVTVTS